MRLKRYLTEAIKPQLTKAVRITMKGWLNFLKELNHRWNKRKSLGMGDLTRMLSIAFFEWDIEFEQASKSQHVEWEEGYSKNDFVLGGLLDLEGIIYLQLHKTASKKMVDLLKRRDNIHDLDKLDITEEVINILSHELVHREAYKKAGVKSMGVERKKFHWKTYLKDTQEIYAFAQQYANDVYLKRDSDIEEIYRITFGKTHKVYKKFMRRYRETLDALKSGDTDKSLD